MERLERRRGLALKRRNGKPDFLGELGELILTPRSPTFRYAFAVLCFATALSVRFIFDEQLPPGFPFLTFFPAVLLAAVFSGMRLGIAVAIVSGLSSWFFFIPPGWSFHINSGSIVAMIFYTLVVTTELVFIAATGVALRRLAREEKRSFELAHARELMFNELQHRVSNNLATVAALLRMQASRVEDADGKKALSEAQLRINTISRLQRRLHSPNIQSIDIGAFLQDLVDDCLDAAGAAEAQKVTLSTQSFALAHDKAIPLGLIVSEVLMNAVEHGAEAGPGKPIEITMQVAPSPKEEGAFHVVIAVRDHGAGVPEGFAVEKSRSLGLGIARQFATQLGGQLTITNAPGGGALSTLAFDAVPVR
jgi:two-component sensor histidine kinase